MDNVALSWMELSCPPDSLADFGLEDLKFYWR
jgi:hypothetical protein